jgi:two-component system response regulator
MPRLGGIEVLQRIRADERTKLLPVVVLTTSNEDADRIDSYRLGANSYEQLGLYWLVLNESPR